MTDDQGALWGQVDQLRGGPGPVERATRESLQAAQLDPRDNGAGEALATLAWALDAARAAGKFYGVAQAGPPYLDAARALGLTVDGRKEGGDGDGLDDWLRKLTSPTVGDRPQP